MNLVSYSSKRVLLVVYGIVLPFCSSAAERDKFGIVKIYADAQPPVNNWAFNGKVHDKRFSNKELSPQERAGSVRRIRMRCAWKC